MHGLRPHRVPFLEPQRPVVHAGRQAETVFRERRLAPVVALVHRADLRHRDVALVGENQRVVGQIFEQRRRRLARAASGEIARVVLDPGAGSRRLHHFQVEYRALLEPLRLQQAAVGVQEVEPLFQLLLDRLGRLQQRRARRDVMAVGVDLYEFQVLRLLPGQRVEFDDRFDLVAEEADPPAAILVVRGEQFERVAAHAKNAAREIAERALVLQRDEVGDDLPLVDLFADLQRKRHRGVGLDRADAVDAGDRGDDDDVVALQHRARGGVAHAVDLLVDRRILLDIGVGARNVGFGLVVIVIGDEILDRVVREEAPELAIELRGERLVRRQDQRRPLRRLDDLGHREGLAGAGDAEQHLVALVLADPLDELADRLRLVALGVVFRNHLEPSSALGLRRPLRPVRRPRRPLAQIRIAEFEQRLQRFDRRRRAGHAARVRVGLRCERGLRRFGEALRLLDQRRVQQRREMLAERIHVGTAGLRLRGGFCGFGHPRNMGRKVGCGKAPRASGEFALARPQR